MNWWQAVLVLSLFGVGFSLGRSSGNLKSELAHHTLDYFFIMVAQDMAKNPSIPFKESLTVKMIQKEAPFDWTLFEGDEV